jgi:alanine racemase
VTVDPSEARSAAEAGEATRLKIDLGALMRNWRTLCEFAPGAECAAVVKADAYGLGADRVVPALSRAGCATFFVATLAEGVSLRKVAPDAAIYILDGTFPGSEPAFAAHDLRPVLSSGLQVEAWMNFADRAVSMPSAALHVDTGMTRLGLNPSDLVSIDTERLKPALVMSHLACAEDPHHPKNGAQLRAFELALTRFPGVTASLANSAGMLLGSAYRFDLVRPGVAIYGGRPSPFGGWRPEPVVTFEARVAQLRAASAGDTIGYGAVRTLKRSTRIAVAAAGYADGYMRAAGSSDMREGGVAYIRGVLAPVLGRVSMDLVAFDVTELPDGAVAAGEWIELLGPNVSVDMLAKAAGTIPYEILTGIGRRARRVYTES